MINYALLDSSISYYEDCGFKRIEAPWTVTKAISDITKPAWVEGEDQFALKHKDGKVLVASGEQSFLYLYNKGFLPNGKFQTITPCFRPDSFDETHTKYFIKNELIDTEDTSIDRLEAMVNQAIGFFRPCVPSISLLKVKQIDETSYDIEYDGIEIGSYGIRECSFLKWIFGTGLAEPRFSRLLERRT